MVESYGKAMFSFLEITKVSSKVVVLLFAFSPAMSDCCSTTLLVFDVSMFEILAILISM